MLSVKHLYAMTSCAFFGLAIGAPAHAASDLPRPEGEVILTLRGHIAATNGDGIAEFDVDMLRALDWREITTFTSFTSGPQQFAGPTLKSVLDAVGAHGEMIEATAINGYFVEIPLADAADHDVLLAHEHNGLPMRIRDKGPLWVVYPLDEAGAAAQTFDIEMIWQLESMEIISAASSTQ